MSNPNICTRRKVSISQRCSTPIGDNSERSTSKSSTRSFSLTDASELSRYFTCSNLAINSTNRKNLRKPRNITKHVLEVSPNASDESQEVIKMKIVIRKKKQSTLKNKNTPNIQGNIIKSKDMATSNSNISNVNEPPKTDRTTEKRQPEQKNRLTTKSNDMATSNSNASNFSNISSINNSTQMTQLVHDRRQALPIMGSKALLAQTKCLKTSDAQIVQDLVLSKYCDVLLRYYQRSLERKTTRKWFSVGVLDSEQTNLINKLPNVSDQGLPSAERQNLLKQTQEFIHIEKLESGNVETKEEHREVNMTSNSDDYSEFDSQVFLRAALGDDMYCSMGTDLNSSKRSATDPNIIEQNSINTDNISALLSKTSMYSSIPNHPKKEMHLPLPNTLAEESSEHEKVSPKQKLKELLIESSIQREIINQSWKALNFCKASRELIGSNERIEAERILLIASYKRQLYQEEIAKNHYETIDVSKNLGSVRISGLRFALQSNDLTRRSEDFAQLFICIVSCGMEVLYSEVTILKGEKELTFDKEFRFDGLGQDFEIILSVYSMKLSNDILNQEEELHHREGRSTFCPNPKEFFTLRRNRNRIFVDDTKQQSSFVCCGKAHITQSNLTSRSFRLTNVPLRSNLTGSFKAKIHSQIYILRDQLEGFLNVGMDINGLIIWNRRWCVLQGEKLMYWNYPSEQFNTKPIALIDLRDCLSTSIGPSRRDVCARPKTLSMDIRCFDEKSQLVKDLPVFLSSDTMEEMKNWNERINSVLNSLANWHCLNYLRT